MVSFAKDELRYFSRNGLKSEYDQIRIRRIIVEDNVQDKRLIVQAVSDAFWTEKYPRNTFIQLMTAVHSSFI